MSMRISSPAIAIALTLAACSGGNGNSDVAPQQQADAASDGSEKIACAHGNAALAPECTVERTEGDEGLVLTIRHPDGAFRRLLVTTDGRGVAAADGAQQAVVSVAGDQGIDVALGGDRYRLPATVGKPVS